MVTENRSVGGSIPPLGTILFAWHFSELQSASLNFIDTKLEAMINQQVAHLTADRTANATEQLGQPQWKKIIETIEREISRFEAALTPPFRQKFCAGLELMIFTGGGTGQSSFSIAVNNAYRPSD